MSLRDALERVANEAEDAIEHAESARSLHCALQAVRTVAVEALNDRVVVMPATGSAPVRRAKISQEEVDRCAERTEAVDAKGNVVPGAWTVRPARMLRYEQAERVVEAVRDLLRNPRHNLGAITVALAAYDALKAAE